MEVSSHAHANTGDDWGRNLGRHSYSEHSISLQGHHHLTDSRESATNLDYELIQCSQ